MSILESKKLKTRILLGYAVPLSILTLFGVSIGVVSQLISNTSERLRYRQNPVAAMVLPPIG